MGRPWGRSPRYHEWPSSTPVIDAIATVVAVASVVIGAYAGLFLTFALDAGDEGTAVENGLFLVSIGVANGGVEALRHWRRHHG